jgi:hypothetical protein
MQFLGCYVLYRLVISMSMYFDKLEDGGQQYI